MRILDQSGRSVTYMHDEDGKTFIGTLSDVSDVAERVKAERAETNGDGELGHHICTVPLSTLDDWAKKRGLAYYDVAEDDKLMKQFLAEHPAFLVRGGWQ